MKVSVGGGNIAVAVDSTVGTTHTTKIYMFPLVYVLIVVAIVALSLWVSLRGRKGSSENRERE
jgi:hypothetical protein